MTSFVHTQTDHQPLKAFFEPKTLTELGVLGHSITVAVGYEACQFEKTGMSALARKIPVLKGLTPFKSPTLDMDIDLSCLVLDESHQILDKVWYANVRGLEESVRYVGSLSGATHFEEALTPQESITIRLSELPASAQRLIFVMSSYHKHSLCHAKKGTTKIMDNEGVLAYGYSLDTITLGEHGVVAWMMERHGDDFRISAPQKGLGTSFNPANLSSELDKLVGQF